ncbi:hypothetical protein FRB90_003759 [Tulasnella sp. 427]|nr:hypothetical protein FRB90_003759 [Tulasnella sp. 427]
MNEITPVDYMDLVQSKADEAITLDRQFSNSPYNTPQAVSNGLESRRLGVKELLSVLPEVQRRLVDVRLENDEKEARPRGRAPLHANDLTMSWEKLDASTSSLRPPAQASSLSAMPPSGPRSPLLVPPPLVPPAAFRRQANTSAAAIRPALRLSGVPNIPEPAKRRPAGLRVFLLLLLLGPAQRHGRFPDADVDPAHRLSGGVSVPLPPPATSGADVGDSLFRSAKPVDVEQSQPIMKKGSFGKSRGLPSELQPRAPPPPALEHPGNDAGDEGSSDDDELVLNASREKRPVKSGRMEEPRRDVAENGMGDAAGEDEAKEEVGQGSSALPGSFPIEEDATRKKTLELLSLLGRQEAGRGKLSRRGSRRLNGRSQKAPTPSATTTTTAARKQTTSRTVKASASKSTALTRNSTSPTDEEDPRAVRRSSRLSVTPSVTDGGGRHASPDRKKARSSAEPKGVPSSAVPVSAAATTRRKSGRTSKSGGARGKVAGGGRTVSGRTTRGQVQSTVEED